MPDTKPNQTPRRRAELVRLAIRPDGAFGVLLVDGRPLCLTLERTYPVAESVPGGPQFLKIPPGAYRARRTWFARGGYETFEVVGVIGHSRLLFHRGNVAADSDGCVLVGLELGAWSAASASVQRSREAFAAFAGALKACDEFELVVRHAL